MLDRGAGVDQDPAGHVAVDLEVQDFLGFGGGLLGRIGELDTAGLHPAAGQHLRLDHYGAADLLGYASRLVGALGETVLGDGDPRLGYDRPRLVLEEAHRRRGSVAEGSRAGVDGARKSRLSVIGQPISN